jgi:hypothetical protein
VHIALGEGDVVGNRFSQDLERKRGIAAVGDTHRQSGSQSGIG